MLIGGVEASTFEDRGDQYPVFLRAAEHYRDDPAALSLISVPSRTLGQVPLSDVITLGTATAVSKITRQSRERAVIITMNVAPGYPESAVVAALTRSIGELQMPPGYSAEPFGRSKEMAKLKGAFMLAIGLAFIFMYLVLAAQFESWLHPLTIMLSLPLTVPFALLSLVLTGGSLNIFSMLGVIVLFAMVKKNAILQVDHTNELRRGRACRATEAVLEASTRSAAPDPDDDVRVRRRHVPLVTSVGRRLGVLERDGERRRRRPDPVAPAHAGRDPGDLHLVRRPPARRELAGRPDPRLAREAGGGPGGGGGPGAFPVPVGVWLVLPPLRIRVFAGICRVKRALDAALEIPRRSDTGRAVLGA